ncbi:hypothetical protein OK349_17980 [Sphingomonas sp. BT-65]|uniref:hypothetical protein n=1 Tax=Sphingomonas sp. BT-65 TaxID=2989821 RepID=UPI002236B1C2|nr:hypothetical protein [Sphingomonas sp. BT-65]MCW4463600.1 hypothetical protein [Sphingomonas sp. BT-65]
MALLARLFLIAAVLWCCANVAEPAQAHGSVSFDQAVTVEAAHQHSDGDCADRDGTAQAGHHHCHVAPDLRARANDESCITAAPMTFTPRVAPLRSFAQAPPLQPPSA